MNAHDLIADAIAEKGGFDSVFWVACGGSLIDLLPAHELLKRDDIFAVSICLPPAAHCEVACAALAAGKHVLCEKPMAPSLEECDRMIAAAKASGKTLSIVSNNRFNTSAMRVKAMLDRAESSASPWPTRSGTAAGTITTSGGAARGKRSAADARPATPCTTWTCCNG